MCFHGDKAVLVWRAMGHAGDHDLVVRPSRAFVDLKPVVDENFFFSTSDPGVQQSKKVEQRFPSQPQLILAVSAHDITSQRYLSRLQRLTQKIQAIDEVTGVKSLTAGPKSTTDALASPFWRRLLVAKNQESSNVIIFLENTDPEKPIKKIEKIVHKERENDFQIHIAGPPYVVELIRRSLAHDFWYYQRYRRHFIWCYHGSDVPVGPSLPGHAGDLYERSVVDPFARIDLR
jgi:hypothetical protein